MTLSDVKTYLRIDEDYDDIIIETMMDATQQYITDAVGFYDANNAKIKMLFLLIMQDFYENRVLVIKNADEARINQIAGSIILQLQTEALLREGGAVG